MRVAFHENDGKLREQRKRRRQLRQLQNKELNAGLAAITETSKITKTTGIQGANHGFPPHSGFRNTRALASQQLPIFRILANIAKSQHEGYPVAIFWPLPLASNESHLTISQLPTYAESRAPTNGENKAHLCISCQCWL